VVKVVIGTFHSPRCCARINASNIPSVLSVSVSEALLKSGDTKMSTWVLTVYGALPDALPTGMADEWEATLKGERARILTGLLTKIPDEANFLNRLADASSDVYELFGAGIPAPWDKNNILTKQRVKLARKYADWDTGIDNAFKVGGTFETNVTAKKGKLEAARYTIGVVGNRSADRWRFASLLALALGGDTRIARYITSPDTLAGTIEVALNAPYNKFDRPFIVATCVKHAIMAKYCDVFTDKTLRDAEITALNTDLNIIEGHKVSGSTLVLTASWDGTYNHVKIIADYTKP